MAENCLAVLGVKLTFALPDQGLAEYSKVCDEADQGILI